MEIAAINQSVAMATATVASPPPETPQRQRELIHAVKAVDASALFGEGNELTFVLDRATGKTLARIVNSKTGDVVMQLPPEYVLEMAKESEAQAKRQQTGGTLG